MFVLEEKIIFQTKTLTNLDFQELTHLPQGAPQDGEMKEMPQ